MIKCYCQPDTVVIKYSTGSRRPFTCGASEKEVQDECSLAGSFDSRHDRPHCPTLPVGGDGSARLQGTHEPAPVVHDRVLPVV